MKRAGFGTHRRQRLDLLLCSSYFKKLVESFGNNAGRTVIDPMLFKWLRHFGCYHKVTVNRETGISSNKSVFRDV